MAITGQIVITRCNLLSNVNVVLSSSLHRCHINIWLIKLSSLDVIFDAPSVNVVVSSLLMIWLIKLSSLVF